jgi:hypothetical protein
VITKETRAESLNELDKTKRYEEIRYALKNEINGLTARELAKKLGSEERNYVAPRLTELTRKNEIKVISKRYDKKTKRNVAVYALNDKKYYEQKSEKIEKAYNNYLNEKTKENIEKWKGEVSKDV